MAIHDSRLANDVRVPALDALLLFFILNLLLQPLVEPDFGWHLRTGLDLLRRGWGMPATDPYSHTVPDWPWVEHAWLTDSLIGLIYTGLGSAGPFGVILFFAGVTGSAFALAAGMARAGRTQRILAVAGGLWIALPFLGARTQMVTLLWLALVLRWYDRYQAGRLSHLWGLPPLFLLWANVHGGFTAGLFALTLILTASVVVRVIRDSWPTIGAHLDEPTLAWSQLRHLALIVLAASLATLVNPYGWRLHAEIYQSLTDRFMIETLHEWQPVSIQNRAGLTYIGYLSLLGLLCLTLYRRIEPVRWVVLGVFLGLSLLHWRNVLFFLLVSVPLGAELLSGLIARVSARFLMNVQRRKRWLLSATFVAAVGVTVLGSDHLQGVVRCGLEPADYFRTTEYPIEAVQWIKAHRDQLGTRLYNDYGFGGFLLWWMPEEKIFIDGRMPTWRVGDRWIFYDYVALTSWDPPELRVLDKYQVDWAIVTVGTPLGRALAGQADWRKVYGDAKVTIYARR